MEDARHKHRRKGKQDKEGIRGEKTRVRETRKSSLVMECDCVLLGCVGVCEECVDVRECEGVCPISFSVCGLVYNHTTHTLLGHSSYSRAHSCHLLPLTDCY